MKNTCRKCDTLVRHDADSSLCKALAVVEALQRTVFVPGLFDEADA